MNILSVSNPIFSNSANTSIELTLVTDKFGTIQFSAMATDPEKYGRDLFAAAIAGEFGPVGDYQVRPKTQEEINAEADRAIAKLRHDSFPLVLEMLEKLSNGADKVAIKAINDVAKLERAKKVV